MVNFSYYSELMLLLSSAFYVKITVLELVFFIDKHWMKELCCKFEAPQEDPLAHLWAETNVLWETLIHE